MYKSKLALCSLLLLCLLSAPTFGKAGGFEVGNGSEDEFPEQYRSAWFLGKEKIVRACLDRAADFGVTKEVAAASLERTFRQWVAYVASVPLYEEVDEKHFAFMKNNPAWAMAEHLEIMPDCDGSEDLHVYLGSVDENVQNTLPAFSNPLAFTRRLNFDMKNGWSKGILWVRKQNLNPETGRFPDWAAHPWMLDYELLHEWGHIFGNSHVDGTIMEAELGAHLRYLCVETHECEAPTIDRQRKLYSNFPARGVFEGSEAITSYQMDKTLSRLMGRRLDAETLKCSAKVFLRPKDASRMKIQVECRDKKGKALLEVETENLQSDNGLIVGHGDEIFKRTRTDFVELDGRPNSVAAYSFLPDQVIGALRKKNGSKASVVIQFKMGVFYTLDLHLGLLVGGDVNPFFAGSREGKRATGGMR